MLLIIMIQLIVLLFIDSTVWFTQYLDANDSYSWYITDNNNNTLASNLYYDMLSDGDTVTVYLVTSNVHGCQNDTKQSNIYYLC